jgi:hypothetical protein
MVHQCDIAQPSDVSSSVAAILEEFQDVFEEPSQLPPHREYDHSIPLLLVSLLVNAKPYRYSPLHKDEIERQVKSLLSSSLIAPSSSPFASPILPVQKKDGTWHFLWITEGSTI